jgi:hypothetical protein
MGSLKYVVLAGVFIGLGLFVNSAVMAQTPLTPTRTELVPTTGITSRLNTIPMSSPWIVR